MQVRPYFDQSCRLLIHIFYRSIHGHTGTPPHVFPSAIHSVENWFLVFHCQRGQHPITSFTNEAPVPTTARKGKAKSGRNGSFVFFFLSCL